MSFQPKKENHHGIPDVQSGRPAASDCRAALLSALGSLILALSFGTGSIRALIIASLFGSFISLAFVTRAIWRNTPTSIDQFGDAS